MYIHRYQRSLRAQRLLKLLHQRLQCVSCSPSCCSMLLRTLPCRTSRWSCVQGSLRFGTCRNRWPQHVITHENFWNASNRAFFQKAFSAPAGSKQQQAESQRESSGFARVEESIHPAALGLMVFGVPYLDCTCFSSKWYARSLIMTSIYSSEPIQTASTPPVSPSSLDQAYTQTTSKRLCSPMSPTAHLFGGRPSGLRGGARVPPNRILHSRHEVKLNCYLQDPSQVSSGCNQASQTLGGGGC